MDNNLIQRVSNADIQCVEPTVKMCVADRCVCYLPSSFSSSGAASANPASRCQILVAFQEQRPDMPELAVSSGQCGVNAEIALAMALAYFLKGSAPTAIR